MLKAAFNLTRIPFSKDIATKNLFIHDQFNEMTTRMKMLFEDRGIGLFTGEVGCGKSTAIRTALEALSSQTHRTVYLYRGIDNIGIFYSQIAEGLGIMPKYRKTDVVAQVLNAVNELYTQQKIQPVIIIDEAHLLKAEILDEIRLLHNAQYDSCDYIATALVGQTSLKKMMNYTKFLPLRQRISVQYHIAALSREESYQYFLHQMGVVKASDKIFMDNAIETIIRAAKGIPRMINAIALKSMKTAANQKMTRVDQETVITVLDEMGLK